MISTENTNHPAPRNALSENVARNVTMSSREIAEGSVYVAEFSDGWIKVGRGRNADARIKQHQSVSRMRGASLVRAFKSNPVANPKAVERRLIALCSALGEKVHGNEWFTGVSYESLVCAAQSAAVRPADCAQSPGVSDRFSERVETFLNRLFPCPTEEQIAWSEAIAHARSLERVFLEDGFGGEVFQDTGRGYSKFFLAASIAVCGMSAGEVAETYSDALNCPGDCIRMLLGMADDAAASYRSEAA